MKRILLSSLMLVLIWPLAFAQSGRDRTGYEGDFFSLEGALELFQASNTLRDFERNINSRDRWVNNLDLDLDGRTDYIRVEHRREGDFHAIILQAVVGRYDIQDVAVIEIEQTGRREAVLQIVGDEDMYGEEVYIEPLMGYADSRSAYNPDYGDFVNVYYWPIVQYLLGPRYSDVYVSPYRWQYYPTWWDTWRPVTWAIFRPRIVVYSRRFRIITRPRFLRVRRFYRPFRVYSYNVVVRTNRVRVRYGRPPIYRPRFDNRNRFGNRRGNNRGGRGGVDRGNRPGIADNGINAGRRPSANAGIERAGGRNRGTINKPRVRDQSGILEGRQGSSPGLSPDRRPSGRTDGRPGIADSRNRSDNFRERPQSRNEGLRRSQSSPRTSPSIQRSPSRSDNSSVRSQGRSFEKRSSTTGRRPQSRPSISRSPNRSDNSRARSQSRSFENRSATTERRSQSRPSISRSPSRSDNSRARSQSRSFESRRPSSPKISTPSRTKSSSRPQIKRSSPSSRPSISRRSGSSRSKASPSRSRSSVKRSPRSSSSSRASSSRRSGSSRRRN